MHLKVIPRWECNSPDYLWEILCLPGAGSLMLEQILECAPVLKSPYSQLFVPSQWLERLDKAFVSPQGFGPDGVKIGTLNGITAGGLLISNARFLCRYDQTKLKMLLDPSASTVITVEITPELAAPNELVRRTLQNHIVGFRRVLEDIIEPTATLGNGFPAFLYFSPVVLRRLGKDISIPFVFDEIRHLLDTHGVSIRNFRMGGQSCNLTSPLGQMILLGRIPVDKLRNTSASAAVDSSARLYGPVWLGDGVNIERNAIVAGPAILCKDVHVEAGAVVLNAIIAPGLTVKHAECMKNTIFLSEINRQQVPSTISYLVEETTEHTPYRDWPFFSYPRFGKRIFDLVFSLIILLLISPIFLIVALMLKLTSPGPVFYRARRQGRHGKEFDCLKFRSMMVQADSLQERLRGINQVDGPQFKIDNDPRITGFGKFLRDTCIDELPQFINVLLGQMSVVGPRPSPENENEACPAWRDARLSVRPGITGLWQVSRTRRAEMDFQEWIFYDTRYVRNLSFRQDIRICLKTASKLIHTFLDQFG